MLDTIAKHLKQNSQRPALFVDSRMHSYGELSARTANIQILIERHCPKDNSIIAVVDNADLDTYASLLAILFSGHGYLPINPKNPVERNNAILQQTDVELLLTSRFAPTSELARANPGIRVCLTIELENTRDEPYLNQVPETHLAYLLFTSGSTGIPKGVPISRGNLAAFLSGLQSIIKLGSEDRVLQMFDLTFDFSVMSTFAPLKVGASIFLAATGEVRAMSVYRLLESQEITCAPMVPSILTFLRPYFEDIRLPKLRQSVFCGEPLLAELTLEWSGCSPEMQILNFYGPTEATVFCSHYEWSATSPKSVNGALSIGRPMSSAQMIVVNEQGDILPPNEQGELCLAGEQLTAGYWRNPQKTADTFFEVTLVGIRTRFYRTGDIAYVDDDGDFMYLGRADQQVKVQGFRIELSEIEHKARECAGVSEVVAVTCPNKAGMLEIVLCLGSFHGDTGQVHKSLREKLPPYMIPARIVTFDDLPLNNNGKIDRPSLRQMVIS